METLTCFLKNSLRRTRSALFRLFAFFLITVLVCSACEANPAQSDSQPQQNQLMDQPQSARSFKEDSLPLIHTPRASLMAAQKWARNRSSTDLFPSLAPLYWEQAQAIGLDPLVAYCQAALETGFMKFSSVVPESYHNPCGLKTPQGGGDYDSAAHMQFPNWQTGIQAHLDHLALYAGVQGYPKDDSPDPRPFPYLFGEAKTVESLSGHWAPSMEYGILLRELMEEVLAFE